MKKILILSTVFALLFAMGGVAGATTYSYTFQPSPADLYGLDHYKYYTWGVDWSVPDGERVIGASLFFDNIRNYNSSPNDLWVTALDTAASGVAVGRDNQGGGDYFAGQGTSLLHWQNLSHVPSDLSYTFSSTEVGGLKGYLTDGNFGLGFDPDCHFYNDGITLTIQTEAVPIPGAAWLMMAGVAGLIGLRKRIRN